MQPPRVVHPGSPQPSVKEREREVMVGRVLGVAGSPAGGAGRRTGWGGGWEDDFGVAMDAIEE